MGINSLITFVFASRGRRDKFFACLDNIKDMCISGHYEIICSLDEDDETMNNDNVKDRMLDYENLKVYYGKSKGKIDAINREVDKINPETKVIVNMSDDLEFVLKGFDVQIRNDMSRFFPDLDGVIHYPDGTPNSQRVMTVSVIGINYFKRTGKIYNSEYSSWYADDEEMQKAMLLGRYRYIHKNLFNHKHYIFGGALKDETYKRNDEVSITNNDKHIFYIHKSNNFGV